MFLFYFFLITNNLYHVLLSLKRGTVSARNITLLIDNCVNYYCGLLFNIKYTLVNECFFIMNLLAVAGMEGSGCGLPAAQHHRHVRGPQPRKAVEGRAVHPAAPQAAGRGPCHTGYSWVGEEVLWIVLFYKGKYEKLLTRFKMMSSQKWKNPGFKKYIFF